MYTGSINTAMVMEKLPFGFWWMQHERWTNAEWIVNTYLTVMMNTKKTVNDWWSSIEWWMRGAVYKQRRSLWRTVKPLHLQWLLYNNKSILIVDTAMRALSPNTTRESQKAFLICTPYFCNVNMWLRRQKDWEGASPIHSIATVDDWYPLARVHGTLPTFSTLSHILRFPVLFLFHLHSETFVWDNLLAWCRKCHLVIE